MNTCVMWVNSGRIVDSPSDNEQKAATTLFRDTIHSRDSAVSTAARATRILGGPISRHFMAQIIPMFCDVGRAVSRDEAKLQIGCSDERVFLTHCDKCPLFRDHNCNLEDPLDVCLSSSLSSFVSSVFSLLSSLFVLSCFVSLSSFCLVFLCLPSSLIYLSLSSFSSLSLSIFLCFLSLSPYDRVVLWCVVFCDAVWCVGVSVQNVPVCTCIARTCRNTCARGAGMHGDVLNVHTGCMRGGGVVSFVFSSEKLMIFEHVEQCFAPCQVHASSPLFCSPRKSHFHGGRRYTTKSSPTCPSIP